MRAATVLVVLVLAGCGPGVTVTKVDQTTATQLQSSVRVIEGAVPPGTRDLGPVDATSCKNKAWDASPSVENATLQMKG